jgi:hypothetical protein
VSAEREILPEEAYAMGTLSGILKEAGCPIDLPLEVGKRQLDVKGLFPYPDDQEYVKPLRIRLTVELVQ